MTEQNNPDERVAKWAFKAGKTLGVLLRYGQHHRCCAMWGPEREPMLYEDLQCTCGFSDAIKEITS